MRTTLTIDEDLLLAYKQLAATTHQSLSHVVEDALREALSLRRERIGRGPIELSPLPEGGGLVAGVDLSSHAALTEALEKPRDDELRRRLQGGGSPRGDGDPS